MAARRPPFDIAGEAAPSGRRSQFELPIARLMSGTLVSLPVIVVHGREDGPTLWLSAAIHGDELCGVEIIRRVLAELDPKTMAGTVVALPVVNVHGFNAGDRYLPDRRDLNRSFPGSKRGSLAGRVANLVMTEIVSRGHFGIDLHTGSDHRTNLPQVRADLSDAETRELAEVFGPPVMLDSRTRDGSLRQAATDAGATVLLFEGGEALRFDRDAIQMGTAGVLRVLHHLGLTNGDSPPPPARTSIVCPRSRWLRATTSGICQLEVSLGDEVDQGHVVAVIRDPFGKTRSRVKASLDGVVVGHTQHPLVNRGDALVHLGAVAADG